ncbi:MAG TPA: methyltransferase domain-containing protein [Chitinophagaceae bacterium]|nr:methyltransferase domain-containing protein [Chitinophagaceae bacterium]
MAFRYRSYEKELLDGNNIPFADIRQNMQELNFINQHLGGHQITLKGLRKLINNDMRFLHVAEIGCGGGDNLRVIRDWCIKNNIEVHLTGIDINKECIAFAQQTLHHSDVAWMHCDYKEAVFNSRPNIIFSSLFCHHFTDDELVSMFQWMNDNSSCGFFINDLHRHPLAYHSIRLLTKAFSRSYLVKNDAPLSVKRGFLKDDWQRLFASAGLPCSIQWQWAFRWLVSCAK